MERKVHIKDLIQGNNESSLQGRIVKRWDSQTGAIDFIFVDAKGAKIECHVPDWLGLTLKGILLEGMFFELYNFWGIQNVGVVRLTNTPVRILFHATTVVMMIPPLPIPRYAYDFKTRAQVLDPNFDDTILIDFIGQVQATSVNVCPGTVPTVTFIMIDEQGDPMNVILYDELAIKILRSMGEEPLEILLSCSKKITLGGKTYLQSIREKTSVLIKRYI